MTINPYCDGTDHEDAPACECGGALDDDGDCEDCGLSHYTEQDREEALADRRCDEADNDRWGL